ncbi:PPA1309 family protein [Buchananella hordeovulneris]|uniref:Uncharacterized protein n=1 Tax=Buchananella hordeovulneris TaxID=52770 RepID=A0A1Q5PVT1_9ACTO|nr:PPA1309 family protein [Buchananella hordeovulneris]MDO5080873.1 PPA1309 family protein [Buchananella hordeovulneris]OKL51701.1 hypothetical protein BSZ40_05985 [Buchananella hordeovulneris]RRD43161.1 hypothetical protein EII13_07775 [Buchananella hordeovulneris]RRD53177.1 hypothetical protein EII12_02620 [Buchananella hordeovulneris]
MSTAALPSARQIALVHAVTEIEQHVAQLGWDRSISVFALVQSAALLATSPELDAEMAAQLRTQLENNPEHLTAIAQETADLGDDLGAVLAQLAWPPTVAGMAVTAERLVLPPQVEQDAPSEPTAREEFLLSHPQRQDVRLAVGVLRTGESWCAVRARAHDSDDAVGGGTELAPDLVAAALATFAD